MLEEAPKVETRDRTVVLRVALKTKLKPGQGLQRLPVKIGFTCFKKGLLESERTSLELGGRNIRDAGAILLISV